MPRTSRSVCRRSVRSIARGVGLSLVVGAAALPPAAAHSLALSRGTVDVAPLHLTVTIEVPLVDLMHGHAAATRLDGPSILTLSRAVEDYEAWVRDHLVLRDAAGERLRERSESRVVGPAMAAGEEVSRWRELTAVYRLDYAAAEALRWVTFQCLPDDAGPMLPQQLLLSVRSQGRDAARTVRLTGGGNVETLAFRWNDTGGRPGAHPAALEACGLDPRERLRSVQSALSITEDELRLDISVPLGILETWLPVPRADLDFVEPHEQIAVRQRLEGFFRRHADVRIEGRPVSARVATVAFLDLDDAGFEPGAPERRIGAWTARVAASLRYPTAAPLRLTVDWGLFNSLVLTANAVVLDGERCVAHRFSTYEPRYVWSRGTDH